MHPDYTGKGYGYDFCTLIINHIQENNAGIPIRLSVATFNKRAIHLYEKLRFKKRDKFTAAHAEFITMVKDNEQNVDQ
ncbi:GNAT family N-acetyltransferase [Halobacillus sp. KCTC 3957]|uniref:GNAT family N-acetyltransferase n=2 Tax=Halobacillus yeomjeoni TaxID=311194 RepID=A0A931MTQ7_9BACI|nr:GNAT family N-acetyltransferase [Halobacillus yeomjeoni]